MLSLSLYNLVLTQHSVSTKKIEAIAWGVLQVPFSPPRNLSFSSLLDLFPIEEGISTLFHPSTSYKISWASISPSLLDCFLGLLKHTQIWYPKNFPSLGPSLPNVLSICCSIHLCNGSCPLLQWMYTWLYFFCLAFTWRAEPSESLDPLCTRHRVSAQYIFNTIKKKFLYIEWCKAVLNTLSTL